MNVTPRTVARQIVAARVERAHKPVFTSETGVVRSVRSEHVRPTFIEESDPHCFVCGRHTDHFAEHDDMVEAGTARYGEDGSVFPIPWHWDV